MTKVDVQVKKITSSTWQTPNRHKTTWITFTLKLCDQSTWQTIELTYTKLSNRFIQCTVHYHWPRTRVIYRTCTLYIQCTVHVEDLEAKRKLCYKVARHMTVILYTGPRGKRTEMAGRVEILGQELTGVEAGQRAIHPTWTREHWIRIRQKARQRSSLLVGGQNWMPHNPLFWGWLEARDE